MTYADIQHLTGTDAEVAAQLNAPLYVPTDSTVRSWGSLVELLGLDVVNGLRKSLIAADLVVVVDTITAGVDLSRESTRQSIDMLIGGGILTPEQGATLKSLGGRDSTLWAELGGAGEATEEAIESLRKAAESGPPTYNRRSVQIVVQITPTAEGRTDRVIAIARPADVVDGRVVTGPPDALTEAEAALKAAIEAAVSAWEG